MCIVHKIKVSFFSFINYCYILKDDITNQSIIIDPAWEMDKIKKKIVDLDTVPVAVVLTHSHVDHTNLVDKLIEKYNVKVYISKDECKYYKFKCTNLECLDDGDEIVLGNINMKCILTPGHTVGSMCYLVKDSIFTGDTVFIEGVGKCDELGGNPYSMYESVKKLKRLVNSNVLVYPGHSYNKEPGCEFKFVLKNNIYFQIDDEEKFARFRMRKKQRNLFDFN